MAKNKRKVKASATRRKRTQLSADLDADNSYVLALEAPDLSLLASSSASVSLHPPSVHVEDPASLSPIPEVVSCNLETPPPDLEVVTVEDCFEDEPLADALPANEQLDLDFSDDDGCDMPSPVPSPPVSVLPTSPVACPPSSTTATQGILSFSVTVAAPSPVSSPVSGSWKALFSGNSPTSQCTRLQNFTLNHLTKACALSPEDFLPQFDVWNLCAIGYILGKNPGFKALHGICSSVWKCEATLTIHDSGWLIYRFSCEEDKISVLNGGPYMVSGRPLVLKAMPRFFDFSNEEMSKVPVWFRFPNLPLYCWSPSCLSKIASILGKPIQCDHVTSTLSRMSYARVLVEIDLREELQHSVAVSLPSGPLL
ncbi:hypothetical protein NC651_021395 [Populus alba x Populus x berolinensis]|nr:hypothetical protein NC651_021395 [Populus alba x Populus x berolinensis]